MPGILGLAFDLPSRRVGNDILAAQLGCSAETIERDLGVVSRHYADDGEGPSDLACRAAERALAQAGLAPGDVDFLVFATLRPDVAFPGSGCYLQHKLGCGTIGALDVRAQCAGFLAALDVADQFLRAGMYRRVLVAAADVHSTGLDFSPRGAGVTPLFGDGAAAAILGPEGDDLVATAFHADGRDYDRFWCEYPASRKIPRMKREELAEGRHFPSLDAEWLRETGRRRIREAVNEVLERAGVGRDDVRRFFFQHVFPDVAERAAADLGVEERAVLRGRTEGHVASASLPIALSRAVESGEVNRDDLVCLATAGAGATWGATLLRVGYLRSEGKR